ncbi:hypothetical protein QR680_018556 [Steinernema hermaphroditum]|uniref:Probable oligoribonuclease n=1 Tax=Steinernema hermaphroditum TaxID=289476 RepID=A0AA39HIB2_9BILA|nr:hypothetical protein QR680_018556 [Steinernema hermaphroditum]
MLSTRVFGGACRQIVRNMASTAGNKRNERLIWVDCEMTGLDLEKNTLVEIACIVTEGDLSVVAEGPSIVIRQDEATLNDMNEWCKETFAKNGLTQRIRASEISMVQAEKQVLDFVKTHTEPGKCALAGNTVGMDRRFIDKYMPELGRHFHYRTVDVSSFKEMFRRWKPEEYAKVPAKSEKHLALSDIRESIAELQYYKEHFIK